MTQIYLIGSLRNPNVPIVANKLRLEGFEVFDDWFAPGPNADDYWRDYEKGRGHTYEEALKGWAGKHIYEFDKYHIDRSDIGVMLMPTGKSGHLELGYMIGCGKPAFICFQEEPERWDVMYQFAAGVAFSEENLLELLRTYRTTKVSSIGGSVVERPKNNLGGRVTIKGFFNDPIFGRE